MIATLDLNANTSASRTSSDEFNRGRGQFHLNAVHGGSIRKQLPKPLSEIRRCDTVNGVLIDIHRSLLQYSAECWPWVDDKTEPRYELLRRLVGEQRKDVARLCGWLNERDWAVNFGMYPREFSGRNYISLETLWTMIIRDQESLVSRLERIVDNLKSDDESRGLLSDVLASERRVLEQLRRPVDVDSRDTSAAA